MSELTCAHSTLRLVIDMPICDPVTFENLGRFDVMLCSECGQERSREITTSPTPIMEPGKSYYIPVE